MLLCKQLMMLDLLFVICYWFLVSRSVGLICIFYWFWKGMDACIPIDVNEEGEKEKYKATEVDTFVVAAEKK